MLPHRGVAFGDAEDRYIVGGPYTYSGEPTVRLETSPGRPGLVCSLLWGALLPITGLSTAR